MFVAKDEGLCWETLAGVELLLGKEDICCVRQEFGTLESPTAVKLCLAKESPLRLVQLEANEQGLCLDTLVFFSLKQEASFQN